MGYLYREQAWPEGQVAPYQVRIDALLPGCGHAQAQELPGKLIWLPRDTDEAIRSACPKREEQLNALVGLRNAGVLDDDAFAEKRKRIVHT